jgi:hypothetical protein
MGHAALDDSGWLCGASALASQWHTNEELFNGATCPEIVDGTERSGALLPDDNYARTVLTSYGQPSTGSIDHAVCILYERKCR